MTEEARLAAQAVEGLRFDLTRAPQVTPEVRREMLALLQRSYEEWPAPPIGAPDAYEYLAWKLDGAPSRPGTLVEGRVGDRLVGGIIQIEMPTLIHGQRRRGHLGADAAVDPEFRGRGVDRARRLFQVAHFEGPDVVHYTYSVNPTIIRGSVLAGDRVIENEVLALVRVARGRRFAYGASNGGSSLRNALLAAAALGLAGWTRLVTRLTRRRARPETVVRAVERFDERMDEFATRAMAPFALVIERSREHMNWRYADPRAGAFHLLVAEEGEALVGVAAWKVVGERGELAELLALPDRSDVAAALLDAALDGCTAAGAASVNAYLPRRHPYRRLLRARGFVHTRRSTGVMLRSTLPGPEVERLLGPNAQLHITKGDFDAI